MEQYYHAPGKLSTMVVEVGPARCPKQALNVIGSRDFYGALDVGWTMMMARDAQHAAERHHPAQFNELSLNPGMNIQDGCSPPTRTDLSLPGIPVAARVPRARDDTIDCPTEAQRELFGPTRRRVPAMMDLKNPVLIGPVKTRSTT
ncbi:MAG: hypothetical protein CM1200mP29_06040 [Verrucomicrobiota bacterium]|nr:MAG: hypothetical protein CM1200mP29_06040 [Verrucomicrobiota bacterium]